VVQPGGRDPDIVRFWLSRQFLITPAAALLTFAGIRAMTRDFLDVGTFFTMRSVADAIPTE
jgi:hypothetical protein